MPQSGEHYKTYLVGSLFELGHLHRMVPNRLGNIIIHVIAERLPFRLSIKPISTLGKVDVEQRIHHPFRTVGRGREEQLENRMEHPYDPVEVDSGSIYRTRVDVDKRHISVLFALHLGNKEEAKQDTASISRKKEMDRL